VRPSSPREVVRIQAGKWKGRKLEVPPQARPTSGRARAALFDVLGPDRVASARVLDLYAGSGAVGFEAVSRGAASVVLVDSDAGAIARTCARLSADPEEVRILASEAEDAVARLRREGERFEVVFADPPYRADGTAGGRAIEGAAGLLAERGVLVVQADAGETVRPPPGLRALAERAYGRNVFHFFGIL